MPARAARAKCPAMMPNFRALSFFGPQKAGKTGQDAASPGVGAFTGAADDAAPSPEGEQNSGLDQLSGPNPKQSPRRRQRRSDSSPRQPTFPPSPPLDLRERASPNRPVSSGG